MRARDLRHLEVESAVGDLLNRLLVVDDSVDTRDLLMRNLSGRGYGVLAAAGVEEAIGILESEPVDLVITDLKMPGASGMELVRFVKEKLRNVKVIMITGYPSIDGAAEALKLGAEGFLAKPFTREELFATVDQAMGASDRGEPDQDDAEDRGANPLGLTAASQAMRKLLQAASHAAAAATPLLITGEVDTGKELVARTVHYASHRAASPFLVVRCGAIPGDLLEEELFGGDSDDSASAAGSRPGIFGLAGNGTVFFREIAEAPPGTQARLRQILAPARHERAAFGVPGAVRPRVMASTTMDLAELCVRGRFRDDLYRRLGANAMHVPPLRERMDDLPSLLHSFTGQLQTNHGAPPLTFTDRAMETMNRYTWPGNLGELRRLVRLLVAAHEPGIVDLDRLPVAIRLCAHGSPGVNRSLAEIEADHIRAVLESTDQNKSRAAEILGINRKTLRQKLRPPGAPGQ